MGRNSARKHAEFRRAARQDGAIAALILLNGPPAVGKSSLARRYLDDHPLTLLVEVDAIRVTLGGWNEHEESKLRARALALAMAGAHLEAGHDVIVPQYLGRTDFVDALEALAVRLQAGFIHVIVWDTEEATCDRFRRRRAGLAASGRPHPQVDIDDADIDAAVAEAFDRLRTIGGGQADIISISASDGIDAAYAELTEAALSRRGVPPAGR